MGYENNPFRDDDGEPLMDLEEEYESEPVEYHVLDDDDGDWRRRDRSPSPVVDMKAKPLKRLDRKSDASESVPYSGIGDSDGYKGMSAAEWKRKMFGSKDERIEKKWKVNWRERSVDGDKSRSKFEMTRSREKIGDMEMKEMWDTIAGGHSQDDKDGVKTVDDDFVYGVDPANRYRETKYRSFGDAPQGEADDDITNLFKKRKKKKRCERTAAEIGLLVEKVMAELEFAAEEDQLLNIESKPAINKLKKLPLLTESLSKKQLQQEFLDHGILTVLKNWLEPLPDGSFPNINIRTAILKILTDFPINLEQHDRREQLKKSGLGKVIMFLSKSEEETPSNRKVAKELVNNWSRPIFNKSTRFEEMRHYDDMVPFEDVSGRSHDRSINKAPGMHSCSRDDDLDLAKVSQESKASLWSSRQDALRPEAMPFEFVVRPQSKIDHSLLRARDKQVLQDQRRVKMNKKLQDLKGPKRKPLQAAKISVEGRGMVKYL